MVAIPTVMIILILIGIALFGWWLAMLIDAARIPAEQWQAAQQNQIVYILMRIFLGVIGTLIYVLVARPQLRAVGPPRW